MQKQEMEAPSNVKFFSSLYLNFRILPSYFYLPAHFRVPASRPVIARRASNLVERASRNGPEPGRREIGWPRLGSRLVSRARGLTGPGREALARLRPAR